MLEFQNENSSKVKVVNVTEARGNFARILSDTRAHYIITKNNRAQRVIINFDEFKILQEFAQAYQKEHEIKSPLLDFVADEDATAAEDNDGTILKKSKSPRVIKGIIAEQFKLSQVPVVAQANEAPFEFDVIEEDVSQQNLLHEPVLPEVEIAEPQVLKQEPADPQSLEHKSAEPEVLEQNPSESEESDYFNSNTPDDWSAILNEPESEVLQGFAEESVQSVQIESIEIPTLPEPPLARNPEEEEYFRRYRKLYEGFDAADLSLPEPLSITSHLPKVILTPTDRFVDSSVEGEQIRVPAPQVEYISPQTSVTKKEVQIKDANDDGLPSLQELLKELDQHKLSSDVDDELPTSDIDALISRITTD